MEIEIEISAEIKIEIKIVFGHERPMDESVRYRAIREESGHETCPGGTIFRGTLTISVDWGQMTICTPLTQNADRESGEKLKKVMGEQGITVAALAEATGLSSRTITALRSGKSAGNMATWRIIARRLGRNIDELVG